MDPKNLFSRPLLVLSAVYGVGLIAMLSILPDAWDKTDLSIFVLSAISSLYFGFIITMTCEFGAIWSETRNINWRFGDSVIDDGIMITSVRALGFAGAAYAVIAIFQSYTSLIANEVTSNKTDIERKDSAIECARAAYSAAEVFSGSAVILSKECQELLRLSPGTANKS